MFILNIPPEQDFTKVNTLKLIYKLIKQVLIRFYRNGFKNTL